MINYIKRHERYVAELMETNPGQEVLRELASYHDKQISWMQHERIVHLLVMLFVCLFTLLALGFTVITTTLPCILLSALLLILTVAYIIHYYRLENGVQRWYDLANEISKASCGKKPQE